MQMELLERYNENYEIASKYIESDCGNVKDFKHRIEVMVEIASHCGYDLSDSHDFENCNSLFREIVEIINRINPYSF